MWRVWEERGTFERERKETIDMLEEQPVQGSEYLRIPAK